MSFAEDEHLRLRPDSSELSRLAVKHKTDKSNHNLKNKRNYLDIYENYLRGFRSAPLTLLEIGVRDGASLHLWKEYFPSARIVGIDIDPQCKGVEAERISVRIGDQHDEKFLRQVIQEFHGFDLIIDDGSHLNHDIETSFRCLWDTVKSGGIYIIEDLYNSYGSRGNFALDTIPAGKNITLREIARRWLKGFQSVKFNQRDDLWKFFGTLVSDVDNNARDKLYVHFWEAICVIGKV